MKLEKLEIRDQSEHQALAALYRQSFTPWYPPIPGRRILNWVAEALPEFLLRIAFEDGTVVGHAFALPIYWNGDPGCLESFDYYTADRFREPWFKELGLLTLAGVGSLDIPVVSRHLAGRMREVLLEDANALMAISIVIRPEFRGRRVSASVFGHWIAESRRLGFKYVVGPFRPSQFGAHKAKRRIGLTPDAFECYCTAKRADGRRIDPWLRSVERFGVELLRSETQSVRVARSIEAFERFRKTYKPEDWYQTEEDTWECGEVPTWYVDRDNGRTTSVEPNYWGRLTL